jgi:hypothetical protein
VFAVGCVLLDERNLHAAILSRFASAAAAGAS